MLEVAHAEGHGDVVEGVIVEGEVGDVGLLGVDAVVEVGSAYFLIHDLEHGTGDVHGFDVGLRVGATGHGETHVARAAGYVENVLGLRLVYDVVEGMVAPAVVATEG